MPSCGERRKEEPKIAFGQGSYLVRVCPSMTLLQPPCQSSLPSVYTRRWGRLLMIIPQTSVPFCTHSRTHHFPPQASSLFFFLSSGSHMNNVVPKLEWGQESNGETYCAVKAVCKWAINNQEPHVRRCNTMSLYVCASFHWKRWLSDRYQQINADLLHFMSMAFLKCNVKNMTWKSFLLHCLTKS